MLTDSWYAQRHHFKCTAFRKWVRLARQVQSWFLAGSPNVPIQGTHRSQGGSHQLPKVRIHARPLGSTYSEARVVRVRICVLLDPNTRIASQYVWFERAGFARKQKDILQLTTTGKETGIAGAPWYETVEDSQDSSKAVDVQSEI
jgi:hypothetical protein